MNPEKQIPASFYIRVLRRTGGYYILLSILAAQLVSNLLIAPAAILIQNNAQFSPADFSASVWMAVLLAGVSNAIMLVASYRMSRNAFRRLQDWARRGALAPGTPQEQSAWSEITSLPWRYGLFGSISTFAVVIGPLMAYEYFVLGADANQVGYTFLGGFVAALVIITISAIGIEQLLRTPRVALLPSAFEAQIKGVIGLNILGKLQILTLALIVTGIAIIAPIGYHQIVEVTQGVEADTALREYQFQSLLISGLVLVLSTGIVFMVARAFSNPVRELVETFRKVERGDLKQRAAVIATDETGELAVYFNQMIARLETLQNSLEQQVVERTTQLAAVNEVGRAASAILDPQELIEKVVNLITDRFGHYYAALFTVDQTGKWAELRNATGEAGRVLREARHRLEIGGRSMVGTAINERQPRVAMDVGAEPVRFDNPLLPYTHSEIALPLIVGDRVLGALDVQSTKQSAFGAQDIETLQNMTSQVAIALENARLFQETRQRLVELQTAQRQYVREAWTLQGARQNLEFGVGDDLASAVSLEVPLALRDQVIGQITVAGDAEWSAEERAWVESVATQTAIALENARLMEESREQATIERTVAEITTKIWSANSVEGILRTAAKELGGALGISEAIIELKVEEDESERNIQT